MVIWRSAEAVVLEDEDLARACSVRAENGREGGEHRHALAAAIQEERVLVVGVRIAGEAQHARDRQPDQRVLADPQQPHGRRVHPRDAAGRVRDEHAVRDALERGDEVFLVPTEPFFRGRDVGAPEHRHDRVEERLRGEERAAEACGLIVEGLDDRGREDARPRGHELEPVVEGDAERAVDGAIALEHLDVVLPLACQCALHEPPLLAATDRLLLLAHAEERRELRSLRERVLEREADRLAHRRVDTPEVLSPRLPQQPIVRALVHEPRTQA